MKDGLLKIISFYGVLPQLKYFQSEVFELNEAIIRKEIEYQFCETTVKKDRENLKHIAEEIADVLNMVEQFMYYYDIDIKDVIEIKHQKIDRTISRIEEGYYDK